MRMNEFKEIFESIGINWSAESGYNLRLNNTAIALNDCQVAGFSMMSSPEANKWLNNGVKLRLKSEFGNRHNPQAVSVHYLDYQLGYLPKKQGKRIWSLLNRGFLFYGIVRDFDKSEPSELSITIIQNIR